MEEAPLLLNLFGKCQNGSNGDRSESVVSGSHGMFSRTNLHLLRKKEITEVLAFLKWGSRPGGRKYVLVRLQLMVHIKSLYWKHNSSEEHVRVITIHVGCIDSSMATSSNENIFAAICAGNSPVVPGEFPTQRPVTRSFDVFVDLCLNKRLSSSKAGNLRRHWAHYDVIVMSMLYLQLNWH